MCGFIISGMLKQKDFDFKFKMKTVLVVFLKWIDSLSHCYSGYHDKEERPKYK